MNKDRIAAIKKNFEGVGPKKEVLYTNQEVVDLLQDMQKTMLAGVYEKTHAEYMREKDLLLHFSALAEEYGLKETKTYQRFEKNMNVLGHTVGSYIKGMRGERIARRALKLLSYDKNVKILYNIALEDADAQAEYDAIVLAPYGMYLIEVKNWGDELHIDENGMLTRPDQDVKYDLPGRMSVKESLLREYLGEELFPEKYQEFLLLSNENVTVVDKYQKIPVCIGGGIVYSIREQDDGREILTEAQRMDIAERIQKAHKEQKSFCKVNCDEIVEDYALLMAAMEEAAEGTYNFAQELNRASGTTESENAEAEETCAEDMDIPALNILNISLIRKPKPACMLAGVLAAFGAGVAAGRATKKRV